MASRAYHLATRPIRSQRGGSALILANHVQQVLADINANCGGRSVEKVSSNQSQGLIYVICVCNLPGGFLLCDNSFQPRNVLQ